MCTNNKIHKTFCVLEGKFTWIWIKFGDLMCQFCVCYSTIYNPYMYKHETVRKRLIGYLIFLSVNRNLETTDQLTGYSVKVHNTSYNALCAELKRIMQIITYQYNIMQMVQ